MADQHNLLGKQYIPSNSDDGLFFYEINCARCSRDAYANGTKDISECEESDLCSILAASLLDKAVQWREMDNGDLICTEFLPMKETP